MNIIAGLLNTLALPWGFLLQGRFLQFLYYCIIYIVLAFIPLVGWGAMFFLYVFGIIDALFYKPERRQSLVITIAESKQRTSIISIIVVTIVIISIVAFVCWSMTNPG